MKISIIGTPTDYGQERRGVDMGPSAIRYAGLQSGLEALGYDVFDAGDVPRAVVEMADIGDVRMKHLNACLAACNGVADYAMQARAGGRLPIVLGGDHSLALGSIAAAARGRQIGVLWIDAHGDFNTAATSPSGNIHGMPLAALCGYGDPQLIDFLYAGRKVDPQKVVILGARDLDEGEKALLRNAGIHVFSMQHIDRHGLVDTVTRALEIVQDGTEGYHVSVDLDVMDPISAPGVGTPVAGGFTYREAHVVMEMVAETGAISSLDLVEVNPILDRHNKTAALAAELAWSALGKSTFQGGYGVRNP